MYNTLYTYSWQQFNEGNDDDSHHDWQDLRIRYSITVAGIQGVCGGGWGFRVQTITCIQVSIII